MTRGRSGFNSTSTTTTARTTTARTSLTSSGLTRATTGMTSGNMTTGLSASIGSISRPLGWRRRSRTLRTRPTTPRSRSPSATMPRCATRPRRRHGPWTRGLGRPASGARPIQLLVSRLLCVRRLPRLPPREGQTALTLSSSQATIDFAPIRRL